MTCLLLWIAFGALGWVFALAVKAARDIRFGLGGSLREGRIRIDILCLCLLLGPICLAGFIWTAPEFWGKGRQ